MCWGAAFLEPCGGWGLWVSFRFSVLIILLMRRVEMPLLLTGIITSSK